MKDYANIKAKTLALNVSDIDASTRKVVGYFASFNTLDADGDIIRKGAFAQSIALKGANSPSNRKIAHLWNHDWSEPIGKLLELFEDDYGLKFVSQLGRSTKAQDTFLNYQDGIIREHSVGFYYLPGGAEVVTDKLGTYTNVTNVDLIEGSSVTFGANSLTPVIDVNKTEQVQDMLAFLNKQMERYIDVLRNGEGTDERFYELEMGLRTLQAMYNELIQKEPKLVQPKESSTRNILTNYLI